MTSANPAAADDPDPAELGRRLLALSERVNRGDRAAAAELEDLLDRHPRVWQNYADLTADTTAGWARLLGRGQPVEAACLRRQAAAWAAGLAGPDAPRWCGRRPGRRRWRGWRPSSPNGSCWPPRW